MRPGEILPIPSSARPRELKTQLAGLGNAFYSYQFTNGVETDGPDEVTQAVHDVRARMIFPWLDQLIGSSWPEARCIDLACHQGWFAIQLALRGAQSVLGVDLRPEHVETARKMAQLGGLNNVTFERGNLFEAAPEQLGTFDVTLFLGVLYHLDSPVDALRRARALTRGVCVIETQVARGGERLDCLWGSGPPRSGPAIAVLPSDEHHVESGRDVVLVPSKDALLDIVYAVGFEHVSVVGAPRDSFDQFADGDRLILLAYT